MENKFRRAVERLLDRLYLHCYTSRWNEVYDFYEARYLNPDSPERHRD